LPYFDPWHVVFPPQEPSVEIFNPVIDEADGLTAASEDRVDDDRVKDEREDALHVPKELKQPLPQ
jgi:hypothetical protein